MKKIILLVFSLVLLAVAQEFSFSNAVPVWVESHTWEKQIQASGYDIEQLSILYLPDGGISCRAVVSVRDSAGTHKRVIVSDTQQSVEALGGTNSYLQIRHVLGVAVGELLKQSNLD